MENISKALLIIVGTTLLLSSVYVSQMSTKTVIPPIIDGSLEINERGSDISQAKFMDIIQEIVEASQENELISLNLNFSQSGYDPAGHIDDIESAFQSLSAITSLETLELNLINNSVGTTDYSVLKNFQNLKNLQLVLSLNYGIKDISSLSVINELTTIEKLVLDFGRNDISDVSFFDSLTDVNSHIKEFSLDVWDNSISDVSSLSSLENFTDLTSLSLKFQRNSGIQSIDSLSFLNKGNLKDSIIDLVLYFGSNKVEDINVLSAIQDFKNLEKLSLDLAYNQIKQMNALTGICDLTQLQEFIIYLEQNYLDSVEAFTDLGNLTNLTTLSLDFSYNTIATAAPLNSIGELVQLENFYLRFDDNRFSDPQSCADLVVSLREKLVNTNIDTLRC